MAPRCGAVVGILVAAAWGLSGCGSTPSAPAPAPTVSEGAQPAPAASDTPSDSGAPTGAPTGEQSSAAAASSVAPAPSAPAEPATAFVKADPWAQKGALRGAQEFSTDVSCFPGSELSYRAGTARCFYGNFVSDPCFLRPGDSTQALCEGPEGYAHLRQVELQGPMPSDLGRGNPYRLELADGSTCVASTGAGPQPAPGYPAWRGICRGKTEGIWRAGGQQEGRGRHFALQAKPGAQGVWQVAVSVGEETSKPQLVDVVRAFY